MHMLNELIFILFNTGSKNGNEIWRILKLFLNTKNNTLEFLNLDFRLFIFQKIIVLEFYIQSF